jgi:hypothetical protein
MEDFNTSAALMSFNEIFTKNVSCLEDWFLL